MVSHTPFQADGVPALPNFVGSFVAKLPNLAW